MTPLQMLTTCQIIISDEFRVKKWNIDDHRYVISKLLYINED